MSKSTIICISGWKGSGKDTVANYLAEFGVKRIGFADPLKDLVSELFGVKRRLMDDQAEKEQPIMYMPVQAKDGFSKTVTDFMTKEFKAGQFDLAPTKYWTPRALCILVGSCMRSANPDFWVEKAVTKTEPGKVYTIADCRYKNEIEALKRTGANIISVRINRFDTSPSVDPSERDLDDYPFDIVIENKGTVEELLTSVKELYESIQAG